MSTVQLPPTRSPRRIGARQLTRWLLPLALVVMLIEIGLLTRVMSTSGGPSQSGAASRGVSRSDQPAPNVTATVATSAPSTAPAGPTSAPIAAPTRGPAPTATEPASPAAPAAPAPTQRPTPPPTLAQPQPPAASGQAALAPPAPPAAAVTGGASGPAAAVTSFYSLVEQGAFDQAAQLWTPRMRNEYPPAENINRRFAGTDSITVQRADVTSVNESSGQAIVAVELVERVGGSARRWVGSWYLIRGSGGWLLDQPSLQPR